MIFKFINNSFFCLLTFGIALVTQSFAIGGYDYSDNMSPSQLPPGGLEVSNVPMFISFGFDDNFVSGFELTDGGMSWASEYFSSLTNPEGEGINGTYDGTQASVSFYHHAWYSDVWHSESNYYTRKAWNSAMQAGHEVGNHTYSHFPDEVGNGHAGLTLDVVGWQKELDSCNHILTKPYSLDDAFHSPDPLGGMGAELANIHGFRAPYLEYSNNMFSALKECGFLYDCSIEEGFQPEHDGTNLFWPYTLNNGSPGHKHLQQNSVVNKDFEIAPINGLWEMPVYPFIVPTDEKCLEYGLAYSLRKKIKEAKPSFDSSTSKIRGFDYNLIYEFGFNKEEIVTILKYNLDLRLAGNRAPFLLNGHSEYYSNRAPNGSELAYNLRQDAIEEFFAYAISKPEMRVVSYKKIIDWMRTPTGLDGTKGSTRISSYALPNMNDINLVVSKKKLLINGMYDHTFQSMQISNLKGEILLSTTLNSEATKPIDLNNIANGVYIIKFISNKQVVSKRIAVH